jgi:hypothetical protein
MPRIISFSIPGSRSAHICAALVAYLKHKVNTAKAPEWYVEGKDYSYLPVEVRKQLEPIGYVERCIGCGREITIGLPCSACFTQT